MSIKKQHYCPICNKELDSNQRYPTYVCKSCAEKASDINGRELVFENTSVLGGYKAFYADAKEQYEDHICYINGIKCYADEARFGGIVIQTIIMEQNK
jgi:protein-arginine kinase activator protein McsA